MWKAKIMWYWYHGFGFDHPWGEWEEQEEKEARAIYAQSYWDRTLSLNPL